MRDKSKKTNEVGPVTRKTTLGDAISLVPDAGMIMFEYGLHCIGCHISAFETIEDGCKAHGLSDDKIDELVKRINERAGKQEVNKS